MTNIVTETSHVDTLIITVGTRQIGWRCKEGVIRSFGADGNIGYPAHVNQLYQELGIERGIYQENDKTYPWSARDLGQRYYDYAKEWLGDDFNQVELLLDQKIIEAGIKQGLKHIILWGTDQPETVSWFYRRLDTLWLAELMAGKIKNIFPDVRVDIHTPKINANDSDAIRKELELLVLKEAISSFSPNQDEEFVLWIQNKGCTPAIASGVEICAAALVRQCQVFNASPDEPEEFFPTLTDGSRTATHSQSFKLIPMGEYFWSLERLRIISAWERGDFSEAQFWLKVHQNRQKVLYKLAGILVKYTNCESDNSFFQSLEDWLRSNDVSKIVNSEIIKTWQEQSRQIRQDDLIQAWESTLLIELPLHRQNYTAAFVQFAQILERLLYIQSRSQNWLSKGFITLPSTKEYLGNTYEPGLAGLIKGWCKSRKLSQDNKWCKLLDRIRDKRNNVIHKGAAITLSQIRSMWADDGLFPVKYPQTPEVVKDLMMDVLKEVGNPPNLDQLLLQSLYKWSLNVLNNAT
ncbi:hypothetical protein [Nostoc sp. 'Peltigera membranacea cyanobiont' N6]|uniref:hypothetical protein n=1 Tax=Nostoc sp. 'Peltigera membranacea cyanobiont' N6 TaxID=1261031 RepID=UPI000CF30DFF|nr:hypothetical protein [Nostoc sp. 'Peltigera membranacea cyanobiont' N6]AVH66345.1 hypothetical protein NPM_4874 [Nostoc sp. 'Peltigera membranacea cyanobiont' N6]